MALSFSGSVDVCQVTKKDTQGWWITAEELGLKPNPDGTMPRFLIRTTYKTNTDFENAKNEWRRRHAPKKTSSLDLPDHMRVEMILWAFAKACLLDWEYVLGGDKKPVKFERGMTQEYRRLLPRLFDKLLEAATLDEEDIEAEQIIQGES